MKRKLAAGIAMATVSGSGVGPEPTVAGHLAHTYSVAYELSAPTGAFTGIKSKRIDRLVASPAQENCSSYYSGHPVYQTQWNITNGAANWVEIGTGHQCTALPNGTPNFRYHFWGRGNSGGWNPLGEEVIGATQNIYVFLVQKFNATQYSYKIGGVQKTVLTTPHVFDKAQAGLESWWPNATVSKYLITELAFSTNGSTAWTSFAGQDYKTVNTPTMCGSWNSATAWNAGENVAC